jgi:hypothetical protein
MSRMTALSQDRMAHLASSATPTAGRIVDLTDPTGSCLRLLAEQVPLSLLMDLALPTDEELYEDMLREQADTSWIRR